MMQKSHLREREGGIALDAERPIPIAGLMDEDAELVGGGCLAGKYPRLDAHRMRAIHHHVFLRTEETPTQSDPFPHVHVRDVFPRDFYAHLIQQLPDDDRYKPFPPPLQSRLSIDLKSETAAELGPFWQTFEAW